jgi:hypothetical protein
MFKLCSNPVDKQLTTYKLTIPYFTSETLEELLLFLKSVCKIFVGQNATNGPEHYAIMHCLLQGDALAVFDRATTTQGTETGASKTIVSGKHTTHLRKKTEQSQIWKTAAGRVQYTHKVTIQLSLPEFYESTVIQYKAHVFHNDISYDLIIGRDLIRQLGIKVDLETDQVRWEDTSISMKSPDALSNYSV